MRILFVALFASSSALLAQTTPVSPSAPRSSAPAQAVVLSSSPSLGCPILFTASRFSNGGLVETRKGAPAHDLGLRLSFDPFAFNTLAITQARVTLHGLDRPQVVPAGSDAGGSAKEEFSFAPQQDRHSSFHTVVFARKLVGVQSVELNELTYADGTQWHEAAGNPCRITPNGFTLVATAQ